MKKIILSTIIISTILLSSCITSLSHVKENPQHYNGKSLSFTGQVTFVQKIPLTKFTVLIFKDESESSAVVFTSKEHNINSKLNIKGKILAIEENSVNDASSTAVKSISDFLIYHRFAERDNAIKISKLAIKIIRTLSNKAGALFFIIEE